MKSAPEYVEAAELSLQAAENVVRIARGLRCTDDADRRSIAHHHRRAEVFASLALAAATHRPAGGR